MAVILLAFVAYRFYKIRDNTGENKRFGPSLLYITMEIGFFNLGVGLLALI
jgi:polycystin 2